MKRRVRFWVYANEPTKLTLEEGQRLTWVTGGPCEEGYSWTETTWSWERGTHVVRRETYNDSRDCDGRHESESETEVRVCVGVRMRTPSSTGGWPDWQSVSARQRDHFAEAMRCRVHRAAGLPGARVQEGR